MRPTVALFDIDGTLVSTGGAGRRAIEGAFLQTHGRSQACRDFVFDGMTDRAIARRGLEGIGVEPSEDNILGLLRAYVACLEHEVRAADPARYVVHPGTERAVLAARERGFAVGLGTGNIRDGAKIKLEHVGLFRHFDFGGFGDDHESRPELIRAGAERGASRLSVSLSAARVVVIGDTPKDIVAAQAIGAECLAVATGAWTVEALTEHGATWAFESLEAPGALAALLGEG